LMVVWAALVLLCSPALKLPEIADPFEQSFLEEEASIGRRHREGSGNSQFWLGIEQHRLREVQRDAHLLLFDIIKVIEDKRKNPYMAKTPPSGSTSNIQLDFVTIPEQGVVPSPSVAPGPMTEAELRSSVEQDGGQLIRGHAAFPINSEAVMEKPDLVFEMLKAFATTENSMIPAEVREWGDEIDSGNKTESGDAQMQVVERNPEVQTNEILSPTPISAMDAKDKAGEPISMLETASSSTTSTKGFSMDTCVWFLRETKVLYTINLRAVRKALT